MKDVDEGKYLDVCQSIEVGLKMQYELHADLSDAMCVFALDNAKIALKKHFGYAKNEKVTDNPLAKGIIAWCVDTGVERVGQGNALSLKEYLGQIEKIKRSVVLHSDYGIRGYYEFIKNFV